MDVKLLGKKRESRDNETHGAGGESRGVVVVERWRRPRAPAPESEYIHCINI